MQLQNRILNQLHLQKGFPVGSEVDDEVYLQNRDPESLTLQQSFSVGAEVITG